MTGKQLKQFAERIQDDAIVEHNTSTSINACTKWEELEARDLRSVLTPDVPSSD